MSETHPTLAQRLAPMLRSWALLGALAGLVALGALYWSLFLAGRRSAGAEAPEPDRIALNAEQRKLSDDIGEMEKRYQRGAGAEGGAEKNIELLEQAMARQRDLLRLNPRAGLEQSVRLDRLEIARDNEKARLATVRVAALEAEAEAERRAGRADSAAAKLREALQLQRSANNSNAEQRYKNLFRETSLAQTLETAEAEPLHRELETALREAQTAAAAQRWTDALAAYGRARDAQTQLNQRYGRTKFADQPGLDAIEAEIASLNAAGAAAEIDAREKEADAAAELGRALQAAELYQRAREQQLALNTKFARSRFVSAPRAEELEIKRQTVLSAELLAAATALDRTAAASLLKRQVVSASQKIADASALLERVQAEFPKSRLLEGALRLKLSYLLLRRGDLRQLQDQVYDRLLPVPDVRNTMMLRSELPQELYARVMGNNPSRHTGPALPVDSVSWPDAKNFCQRLSWLLGTSVRLPTLREYRAALGENDGPTVAAENSSGQSQPTATPRANAAGFNDLAGNLAEWLEADSPESAMAPVVGGSYLDPAAALKAPPVTATSKTERARHIGFRVVIELEFN